jgi:hypothetical protein
MRQRAERAILDSGLSAAERAAWLRGEGGPSTGDGKLALAQALRQLGQTNAANALAREVWRSAALSPRAEQIALAEFAGALSSEDHAARLDFAADEPRQRRRPAGGECAHRLADAAAPRAAAGGGRRTGFPP